MEINEELVERFVQFHRGLLSKEEAQKLQEIIEANPKIAEVFEETGLLVSGFRSNEIYKEAKVLLSRKTRSNRILFIRMAAAAIILLVGLFSYLALSSSYFPDIFKVEDTLMGTDDNHVETKLSPQEYAYKEFINGQSFYESQDFKMAIQSYQNALQVDNLRTQYKEAIEWHLCTAYLRHNDIEAANTLYNELIGIPNPKFEVNLISKWKIAFQIFLKKYF
ncbi:hypothetical protein [Arcticibacterium luteifluviistationis]|uniref:Tetratricopeptide repeat protein n=1 Tax=Arcticibacterium luteifluviistationis TaxID=1784714 RepID=A0A2Z4G964_9BACT|nr:hypothetical protein [Arcticibacterium luteifluviistationis]AWV97684.1 hypothetical protein DJ013_05695 [Arcticibacterium luteifluviistationis]